MVNVLHVFILLMCCVFNNSQNIGLLNLNDLNYEVDDIKLMDETICPKPQPCYSPLKYDVQYRCGSDVTCPLGFKCCRGDCFIHKVCVQPYHVNKLQVFELPTAENASLPKTIAFDISNETLLNDVKVNLSANLKNIFANETGEAIFDAPESLISLAAILPFLKNSSTYLKETVKEYNQSPDEIFEPKPLTKNYETTENSVNAANAVNNDIIDIDDAIVKNNPITGGLSATTIRTTSTTDAKKVKNSDYSFRYKKAKYTIHKNIKSVTLQGTKNDVGGFEDDSDYFEGSGDYGTVSTTPDYIKKEFDGSGDYNIQTDEQSKYEEKSSYEETDSPSSVITFTESNYVKKEYDGSGDYSQKTDQQSKYEEGSGDTEETHTTSSIVSSTSKKVENNGYSKTHHHSPFKNIKFAIIKIKNMNRAIKASKTHFDAFEDDVDYSEGSGTDEIVVGSGNFHKQNENKNISNLVKLVKNNRLFRHAAHYWKQFRKIGDDDKVEGSGSGEGVTLSSQADIRDEISNIASSTDDSSTFLVSSSTQQVREHKQFIGLEDDYYYDLQEDEKTTIINQIPFITISSISTTTVGLEDFKINEDFIDIDGESSTADTMSTIQDVYSKTTLEGSGSGDDDEIISSGDYDYEGSGAFEESEHVSTETSKIPHDKTRSFNPIQTTALFKVVKEYPINFIPTVISTSSESGKEYVLPEKNNPTINQKETISAGKAILDIMKENISFKPTATSESIEQHVFPEKNYENATNSILKSSKINEKEIQKESSVANNILRKYKEDKFETPKHDKAISAAKAALDMMKESTGFEPDDYYEDS